MRNVKIITDTCSDLSPAMLEQYDIDYVKMELIEDEVSTPAYLDWTHEEAHAFYDKMRSGKRIKTAQVPSIEYDTVFRKYLDLGMDVVYISCSSKLSSSVNTGILTAKKVLADYPGAKIICVDSLTSCIGLGMLAMEASNMSRDGKNAEEIAAHIEAIKKTVHQFATVHTLEYFKRAGRVSASKAFFGNLMGIKPILVSDVNGAQAAFKKAKGRANALKEIVALLKENILNPEEQTVYISHSDCNEEDLNKVISLVQSEINCKSIDIGYLGPIVGASVGPDCIGVWAYGKPITFASEE